MRVPSERAPDRPALLIGGLLVFVGCFAVFALSHMFPPAPYGLADDWRVFYAAATLVQHGANPYNTTAIHAAEQAAQHYPHVQPSLDDFTNLPIVGLLLVPFALLPYWVSFALFSALGAAIAIVASRSLMRAAGLPHPAVWTFAAMLSWPMLLGFFSGQFDALLLGGLVLSLALARRDRPVFCALCMVVVLLKPHLLWPLPLLLFTAWPGDRRQAWRFAMSAAAVVVGGIAAGFALVPGSGAFLGHVLGFGGRVAAVQPDLAGIPGLLEHLPGGAAAGIVIALTGAAAVITLAVASRTSSRLRALRVEQRLTIPLAGLSLWLACAPYAHPNDDILLFPTAVLALASIQGRVNADWLLRSLVGAAAVIAAFLVSSVVGLALVCVALVAAALLRARPETQSVAAASLVALALLPDVWPFHVTDVSLTPIAAALVALASALVMRDGVRATPRVTNDAPVLRPVYAAPSLSGTSSGAGGSSA